MATLNFSLPEDLKLWIAAQVAAGGYGNTSEYIRELVRLDRKRKSEERLDALLLEGLEKLDAGKGVELTPEFWEQKRLDLLRRHGERTAKKKSA